MSPPAALVLMRELSPLRDLVSAWTCKGFREAAIPEAEFDSLAKELYSVLAGGPAIGEVEHFIQEYLFERFGDWPGDYPPERISLWAADAQACYRRYHGGPGTAGYGISLK